MDKKLESYRRQKRRAEILNNLKVKFLSMIPLFGSSTATDPKKNDHVIVETETKYDPLPNDKTIEDDYADEIPYDTDTESVISSEGEVIITDDESKCFKYTTYVLYFLFWVTCYAITIQFQFGTVYLLLSAICGVYFNTRTGKKRKNEISAYSVFNENCHAIDGTLKAEQFEAELRYGAMK